VIQSDVEVKSTYPFYLEKIGGDKKSKTLVVGFHGYAESGRTSHLRIKRLFRQSPCQENSFDLLTPQGLHSFYGKCGKIVYSWMTKENRELHKQNNRAYFEGVLKSVLAENNYNQIILIGYSQGAAMAWRAVETLKLLLVGNTLINIICIGGAIPPDLSLETLGSKNLKVNLFRGQKDLLYCKEDLLSDEKRLEAHQIQFESESMKTGHRWVVETSRVILYTKVLLKV
jgi:predicted esterase